MDLEDLQKTKNLIVETVLEATKEGRVTDWTERIALIAGEANLNKTKINWNQAPRFVAQELAHMAVNKFSDDSAKIISETIARIKQVQNS